MAATAIGSGYVNPKLRALNTPEGVDLTIEIASYGARIAAFILDTIMIYVILIVIVLLGLWMAFGSIGEQGLYFLGSAGILIQFILRNFWFMLFELGPRGATPGKRILNLRVIARDGGHLDAGGVVARNLMREVEVILPLMFLSVMGTLYGLLAAGWALCFILMPLFNRDRMRVGDIVGGTWVVRVPRAYLQTDLGAAGSTALPFSDEQLDAYGVYEIQTLEDVIRGNDRKTKALVAETIRAKIGLWDQSDDDAFLEQYYAAVRARLEKKLLFGKRRRDKHDMSA